MSESIPISGKVIKVEETKTYGAKGFQKRIMVIEIEDGKFPQKIPVEAVQKNVDLFDGIQEGDEVTAKCNLRGSEYNGKYFLSLQCWKLERGASSENHDRPPIPADLPVDDFYQEVPF